MQAQLVAFGDLAPETDVSDEAVKRFQARHGLVADGVTEVYDIEHIDRGYPDFLAQLRSLGGEIERVSG
mgnify:CR=1 FL=1